MCMVSLGGFLGIWNNCVCAAQVLVAATSPFGASPLRLGNTVVYGLGTLAVHRRLARYLCLCASCFAACRAEAPKEVPVGVHAFYFDLVSELVLTDLYGALSIWKIWVLRA